MVQAKYLFKSINNKWIAKATLLAEAKVTFYNSILKGLKQCVLANNKPPTQKYPSVKDPTRPELLRPVLLEPLFFCSCEHLCQPCCRGCTWWGTGTNPLAQQQVCRLTLPPATAVFKGNNKHFCYVNCFYRMWTEIVQDERKHLLKLDSEEQCS